MSALDDGLRQSAERFAGDTATHEMTVLRDDGLYRHLRFRPAKGASFYWFDLITVPGTLIFQGDGTSYVFRRTEDMFEFFRNGSRWGINPHYWSEKLTSHGQDEVRKYDRDLFIQRVTDAFVEAVQAREAPTGLGRAVREEILDSDDTYDESGAHRVLRDFEFWKPGTDRYRPGARPDFAWDGSWEWDFRDYDWWFLWACHGIAWGIAQYDAMHATAVTA